MTKRAEGCTWNMDKKLKAEVPLQWKLAATNLAKQFYRVICDDWDGSTERLHVVVYRDEDTLNPNYYFVIKRNGTMYRRQTNIGGTMWPCYPEERKEPERKPLPARRRPRVIHKTDEVRKDPFGDSFHSLAVHRTELHEELRKLDYRFLRDPHPDHVMEMKKLREQITELEVKMLYQAVIDRGAVA